MIRTYESHFQATIEIERIFNPTAKIRWCGPNETLDLSKFFIRDELLAQGNLRVVSRGKETFEGFLIQKASTSCSCLGNSDNQENQNTRNALSKTIERVEKMYKNHLAKLETEYPSVNGEETDPVTVHDLARVYGWFASRLKAKHEENLHEQRRGLFAPPIPRSPKLSPKRSPAQPLVPPPGFIPSPPTTPMSPSALRYSPAASHESLRTPNAPHFPPLEH